MNDKQVYFNRGWQAAQLVSQEGTVVTVRIKNVGEIDVPFQQVRDIKPTCLDCHQRLFKNSYQTRNGDSLCWHCYMDLDERGRDLLFDGYQWLSWDGQMSIRDMEDSHLINAIGRLKRNAAEAAEIAGGEEAEYLSPHFPHLVNELRRRRPEDVGSIKMNQTLLVLWMLILQILGRR